MHVRNVILDGEDNDGLIESGHLEVNIFITFFNLVKTTTKLVLENVLQGSIIIEICNIKI